VGVSLPGEEGGHLHRATMFLILVTIASFAVLVAGGLILASCSINSSGGTFVGTEP
jgi:hypothetical protein